MVCNGGPSHDRWACYVPQISTYVILSQAQGTLGKRNCAVMILPYIEESIVETVKILRRDGVIAYPTDTLYGLGGNPLSPKAVTRIFAIKGRDASKGLPLLLANVEDLRKVARALPDLAGVLAQAFWPGPLTLIVKKTRVIPDTVTGGADTVAVRLPAHPVPRALALDLGFPIIGTSANISGGPDPVSAEDVRRELGPRVDAIIDGGPTARGVASTIVDVSGGKPRIARLGALSADDIEKVCGIAVERP
ncbi:MAG: threonylcarbamoyl-AMP synthase [SAR202 cluster bacterium]|nr:threonylcarbamoyl-AMP synthase [SAR202 cluster bacterium]